MSRNIFEITAERDALKEKRSGITRDLDQLHASAGDETLKGGAEERWQNLSKGVEKIDGDLKILEDEWQTSMRDYVAANPQSVERAVPDDFRSDAGRQDDSVPPHVRQARDEGLRTIERHKDSLSAEAGDRLDQVVRRKDPTGIGARYLAAVGDPAYNSAFGTMLKDPYMGHLRFSPQEVEAVRRVSAVEAERAMSLTGATGGFAVPFELDPTILLSSTGAINPVRKISRIEQITVDEWRGVSSDGVTAAYAAEATETTDNSPTLVQPTASTEKAQAFVPFSIEIGQDWPTLQSELAKLLADAKDVLEADKFLNGTGTNEPQGLYAGLTTTQRVQTATTGVYALADVYSLVQALPARFIGNATFVTHPNRLNTTYRFVGGNSTEPPVLATRDGGVLGYRTEQWSAFSTATTTTTKIAVFGDFSKFLIVDRIGLTMELIPHLVGANHRPTGQRGVYCYFRNTSKVLVQNAFRYLEVL